MRSSAVARRLLLALACAAAAGATAADADGPGPAVLAADDACDAEDESCAVSLRQLRGQRALQAQDPTLQASAGMLPAGPGGDSGPSGGGHGDTAEDYKPDNVRLLSKSSAPLFEFYIYRATSDEVYPPLNVNAASLGGVLWYLHHEVVIQYPRKFGITKIVRFKVQTKATQPLHDLGMNFGPRAAFDKGQCTGPFVCGRENAGGSPKPQFCHGGFQKSFEENLTSFSGKPYNGAYEWAQFGYNVGCNNLGEYPFPMYPVYYPNAMWYSLPGPCPSMTYNEETSKCISHEPGGYCKGTPTGTGDCTWTFEEMGHVYLDELVGRSVDALDHEGGREYDPFTDRGIKFSWWDGINSTQANANRLNKTRALFAKKFPNQTKDENLPAPPCDFQFGKFYREFFWKDPNSGPCKDAEPGDDCYKMVKWGMTDGIYGHPEWFPGLNTSSPFKDFQKLLYMQGKEDCPHRPCEKKDMKKAEESKGEKNHW